MTYRDELKRKMRRVVAGSLAFLLAWGVLFLMLAPQRSAPVVAALLPMPLLMLVPIAYYLRCPRCRGGVSALMGYFGPWSFLAKTVMFCPRCGVSLDDDMPAVGD